MARKLRPFAIGGRPAGWMHWCPGCDEPHWLHVEQPPQPGGPQWAFDYDSKEPTFSPDVVVGTPDDEDLPDGVVACHYYLVNGVLSFFGDSAHDLRDCTVELPDWPTEH